MIINPDELSTKDTYKLLAGAVVPRPIAWVSSISKDGTYNLAPYSFFTVASRQPPMLVFSVGPGVKEREGTVKDTLANIRETKEFVINIVTASLGNEMQRSADNVPSEVDEFEYSGLTPAACEVVSVPRVQEAPISMECVLHEIVEVGSDHLIIGRMVRYHVKDELYKNGRIDPVKLAPLGRLAGNYSPIETIFSLPTEKLQDFLVEPIDKTDQ